MNAPVNHINDDMLGSHGGRALGHGYMLPFFLQESPYLFTYRNSNYQARQLKPIGKFQVRKA